MSGERETARILVDGILAARFVPHFWLSIALVGLGDHDAALGALERACEDPDDSLLAVNAFAMFDPIRRAPRFRAVLRRMRF